MPEDVVNRRVDEFMRMMGMPSVAEPSPEAERGRESRRRMREGMKEVTGLDVELPESYWPTLTKALVIQRGQSGRKDVSELNRLNALRSMLRAAARGEEAGEQAALSEDIGTMIRAPGRLASKATIPRPSIEYLQEHRLTAPGVSAAAAAADFPLSLIRLPFQTPELTEAIVTRPKTVLETLIPQTYKELAKGNILEAAMAAHEDPVGTAGVAAMAAGGIRGLAGAAKRGGRAALSAPVKQVAKASGKSRWQIAGMPEKAVSKIVSELEKRKVPKGVAAVKPPKAVTRLQREFVQAVAEGKVPGVASSAAESVPASSFQPTMIQKALKERWSGAPAAAPLPDTPLGRAIAALRSWLKRPKATLPGEAEKMAAEPMKVMGFARERRTEAVRGLEAARKAAAQKMVDARAKGITDAAQLKRIGERAMKPAADNYNFWNNVVRAGEKRGLEVATAELMGTGTAAHAPTLAQQGRTAEALGGAPPALPPLMRGTATRAAAVQELVPPGGGTGTAAEVPRRVVRQTQGGIEATLAQTASRGKTLSRRISERARMAQVGEQLPEMFKKHGWTGGISQAPETVKQAVLADIEGKLAYTTVAGRTYRTVQRSLEKLGLKKQASDLEQAYLRANSDALNNARRFKGLVDKATKEAGGDRQLWAALDEYTPKAEAALRAAKGDAAKVAQALKGAPPAVRELVETWVRHQSSEAVKRGLPLERRLEAYWPQKMPEKAGRIAPSRARTGYLAPEKRAPVGESLGDYFQAAAREKFLRPVVNDVRGRFDKAGLLSPRGGWETSGLARDIMGALEGTINASPLVGAQRALATGLYAGILSAPSSAAVNLTQMMNTAAEHGILRTLREALSKTFGTRRATGAEAVARRLGVGAGKEQLLEATGGFAPTSRLGKAFGRTAEVAMKPFSATEALNKRLAFQTAYNRFKAQGMLPSAAKKAALASVGAEHFWYGPAGTPMLARKAPLATTFMTYPVRQATLMKDWLMKDPAAMARWGAQLFGLGKGLQAAGIAPEPILPFSPSSPLSMPPAGRVLAPLASAAGEAVTGETEAARASLGRAGQEALGIVRPLKMATRAVQELKGEVRGPSGELRYEERDVPGETRAYRALLYGLGFTPEAHAAERRTMGAKRLEHSEFDLRKRRYAKAIADLEMADMEPTEKSARINLLYKEAGDAAPSYEMMREEMKRRGLPAAERQEMRLPRILRR